MTSIFSEIIVNSESDVEQKIIYKLLTNPLPQGLGYSDSDFITKPNIRKLTIDKGTGKKIYFPDYIILINSIPSVIIEAKAPDEDINEALREARLYAMEINARYPHSVNPCEYLFVTDGKRLVLTNWDNETPVVDFQIQDAHPVNPQFSRLLDLISKQSVIKISQLTLDRIRKKALYYKPVGLLGGKAISSQTIGDNSFGANVSLEYSYIFNPETMSERENVAKNAYVASKRKLTHVGTIDKIIRAAIPPSSQNARVIKDTTNPIELVDEIVDYKKIKNQICLLIGGVGSGKSIFTDYLRAVALPNDLMSTTHWVNVNLNTAPVSRDHIYDWLLTKLIDQIKEYHSTVDFDALDTLKMIYKDSLLKLEKGRGSLYSRESEKYADLIYDEIKRLENNKTETFKALIKTYFSNKGILLIVVLDNCDKLTKDDQLLMFAVATWLKDEFPCCVFLPLRDSTYDQYSHLPPLDTVIKDLIFRIDPPLLNAVIYERLKYAQREIDSNNQPFQYTLNNSAKVTCKRHEVAIYLSCIVSSLFQDNFVRRIITGLSGSNLRYGLEIVLEFCKSGHIAEEEILKIRASNGMYKLPNHIITRILLKRKRLYYHDSHSFLLNLFHSERDEPLPDPFSRLCILSWLKERFREYGPNKTRGYHKVSDLLRELQILGHSSITITVQLERLIHDGCVITESQQQVFNESDLISIAPPGLIHLELLKNINYLSAVAEDTYFRQTEIATQIKNNMVGAGAFRINTRESALSTSKLLIDYLYDYHQDFFMNVGQVATIERFNPSDIILNTKQYVDGLVEGNLDFVRREKIISENPKGTHVRAQVVKILPYGIIVEFGLDGNGFIHKNDFTGASESLLDRFEEGDWIEAEVIEFSTKHNRFKMRLLEILPNI